ncbi:unnamed protein product [Cylicostephanus goldi]|uniref:Uncharacterized protein n=1 Tax=Cylicostephanus goldi TaxID=71465 RepID=A0A3P6S2I6_CYLGO|nr:unnamed protein product [Cylicostephanus goldi]
MRLLNSQTATVLIFVLIILSIVSNLSSDIGRTFESHKIVEFDYWHKCIMERFDERRKNESSERLWMSFANITQTCADESKVSRIKLTPIVNADETKYYVFSDNPGGRNLNVIVSIGIGGNVEAELALKEKLTEDSKFYGADPVFSNAELFRKVGTFIPLAVSTRTGFVRTKIRNDKGWPYLEPKM